MPQAPQIPAVDYIREAWRIGRPIVPFLGAGISSHSGFPVTTDLVAYLLKVKFFIKYGVYRHSLGQVFDPQKAIAVDDPENRPSRYLADFGWPVLNQLNSDLYQFTTLDADISRVDPQHVTRMEKIATKSFGDLPDSIRHFNDITEDQRTKTCGFVWGSGRWRLHSAVAHTALEGLRLVDEDLTENVQQAVWKGELIPRADWSALLMELAEGNLGLIDALFATLGLRHAPTLSHTVLAHLTRLLGIKLILTANFDPYVEQAMVREGLEPRVLDVGRDASSPPDPSVVQQALSIVKMHGSGFSFRFGERLNYELDGATRSLVQRYVPDDALMLVVGFSGSERRMMQLLEHIALTSIHGAQDRPKVIWMHQETSLPATLREFQAKVKAVVGGSEEIAKRLLVARHVEDAGQFLLDTYQRLTSTFPKSQLPYRVLPKRLSPEPSRTQHDPRTDENGTPQKPPKLPPAPFQLFVRKTLLAENPFACFVGGLDAEAPSQQLSRIAQHLCLFGYKLIWVDLEEHHTVAGVVTDAIDKMRVYDPDLPPLVLPRDEEDEPTSSPRGSGRDRRFEKPCRFLHRALRRGKYVLAFGTLEGFGRDQTSHHGLPEPAKHVDKERRSSNVKDLCDFLRALIQMGQDPDPRAENIKDCDWYCCIACDEPTQRHIPWRKSGTRTPTQKGDPGDSTLHKQIRTILVDFVTRSWIDADSEDHSTRDVPYRRHLCPVEDPLPITKDYDLTSYLVKYDNMLRTKASLADVSTDDMHIGEAYVDALVKAFMITVASDPTESQDSSPRPVTIFDKGIDDGSGVKVPANVCNADFCFLLFAVYRRPRSYIGLLTLWNEYLPLPSEVALKDKREALDKVLEQLIGRGLMCHPEDDGPYWIPHHLHEWSYKAFTECVRTRSFFARQNATDAEKTNDRAKEYERRVSRLAFLALIHSRISRFYYFNVFHRTHDVSGFFEYLYHQVSALKYGKLIHAELALGELWVETGHAWDSAKNAATLAVSVLMRREGLAHGADTDPLANQGTSGNMTQRDPGEGMQIVQIAALRRKFIQSLLNTIRRERQTVLSSASADTWLGWVEQLIRDEDYIVCMETTTAQVIDKFEGKYGEDPRINKDVASAWLDRPFRAKGADSGNTAPSELVVLGRALRWCLHDLLGQLLREKRAWRRCIYQRFLLLAELISATLDDIRKAKGRGGEKETGGERTSPVGASMRDKTSNTFDEFTRRLREVPSRSDYSGWWRKLFAVLAERRGDSVWAQFALYPDAAERAQVIFDSLMDTIACMRHLSDDDKALRKAMSLIERWFLKKGRIATISARGPSASLELHKQLVGMRFAHSFDGLRFRLEKMQPWGFGRRDHTGTERENVSARDRTCDDVLASSHSSRHDLHGAPFIPDEEFAKCLCRFYTLEAECLLWRERFEDAHRSLDRAANMLREEVPSHRNELFFIYFWRAWVQMTSANTDIIEVASEAHDGGSQIEAALAKLVASEASLVSAEKILRQGRRNISTWRRLYLAKAQLQIEILLWWLVCPRPPKDKLRFVGVIHSHLMKGLEAIRGGWDCCIPQGSSNLGATRDRLELLSLWLELMVAGRLTLWAYAKFRARDLAAGLSSSKADGARFKGLRRQVDELHRQVDDLQQLEHELVKSFHGRWEALNCAVGLERFVEGEPSRIIRKLIEYIVDEVTKAEDSNECWLRQMALRFVEDWIGPRVGTEKSVREELLDLIDPPTRAEGISPPAGARSTRDVNRAGFTGRRRKGRH